MFLLPLYSHVELVCALPLNLGPDHHSTCQVCLPTASGKKQQPVEEMLSKLREDSCRKLEMMLGLQHLLLHNESFIKCVPEHLKPRYKQKAMRTVRTHVKLVAETVKSDDLVKALRDTAACEWKGESFMSGSGSEILGSNKSDAHPFLMMMLPSRPGPQEPLCQMCHDLLRASAAISKTPRSRHDP